MISEKQLEANRRNARKSTGPRTAEGKRASSHNALRHALTAQVSIMTEEDRAAHDDFCDRIVESLAPKGANESDLAQLIAEDRWRLHRIHAVEDNIFALGFFGVASAVDADHPEVHAALTQARVFLSNTNQFNLLSLYAQRTNRDIERNTRQLRQLQAERRARYEQELSEAARAAQRIAPGQGEPFDPAQFSANGFVFSDGQAPASPLGVPALSRQSQGNTGNHGKDKQPPKSIVSSPPSAA